jgi:cobalt-precorrin-7 (C5)-methyltransferase
MNKVYIIGVGPGSKDYILPVAKREIKRCDVLIGARKLLSSFKSLKKETVPLEGDFDNIISYIKERYREKRIGVIVSGDPGLYSLLGKISKAFNKQEYVVIPGVSTISVAAAKIGELWQDFKIISIHGRRIENIVNGVREHQKVALLTDPEFTPEKIANYLLSKGINNRCVIVFENLTYPDERIIETDLKSLSKMGDFGLCLMFIIS